ARLRPAGAHQGHVLRPGQDRRQLRRPDAAAQTAVKAPARRRRSPPRGVPGSRAAPHGRIHTVIRSPRASPKIAAPGPTGRAPAGRRPAGSGVLHPPEAAPAGSAADAGPPGGGSPSPAPRETGSLPRPGRPGHLLRTSPVTSATVPPRPPGGIVPG